MARIEQVFEIFIASPNDVQQERQIVAKVIDEFVSIDGVGIDGIDDTSKGYSLKPVMWEDNLRDFNQTDMQAEINEKLRRCDLTIAVFGGNLGTPTARAPSGAIEEILEFDKELHLYLKKDSEKDLLDELNKHIERMQNRTYYTYKGEEDLRRQVHSAIQRWYLSTILNTILEARSSHGHDVEPVSQSPANNLERRSDAVAEASSVDPVSSGPVSETPGTPARDAQQPTPSSRQRTYIAGSVADLVRHGLLAAGARIICEPRPGERYVATVLASGDIQLSDGRTFNTPSAAGQAVAGRKFSGWKGWRTEDGRMLHELRAQLPGGSGDRDLGSDAVVRASSVDPLSAGAVSETPGTPARDAQQPTPSSRQRTYIAGSVADLVRHGLLAAGARIICEPRTGETHMATVLASGDIQLSDGRKFNNPTAASNAVGGSRSGWETWRTEDGQTLYELRSQLQALGQQLTSGRRTRASLRGSVADLVRHGLLAAGAWIICEPRTGEQYTATVLASGDIQLSDGRTFQQPNPSISSSGRPS